MTHPTSDQMPRHASQTEGSSRPLCDGTFGRTTRPHEIVNCPDCRTILNHVRRNYREYADWRLTPAEKHRAAEDMRRDLVSGEVDD